jgi:hypothetical protein
MSANTNIKFFISTSLVGLISRVKSGLLEKFQVTSGVKPCALNALSYEYVYESFKPAIHGRTTATSSTTPALYRI